MLSQSVAAADGPRAGLKFGDTHRLAQARQRLAAGIAYLHKRRSPRLACTRGRTPSVTPGPDKKLIGRICHNIKADWSCLHGKKVNRLVGQGCSVFTWQVRCQRLRPSGWNHSLSPKRAAFNLSKPAWTSAPSWVRSCGRFAACSCVSQPRSFSAKSLPDVSLDWIDLQSWQPVP